MNRVGFGFDLHPLVPDRSLVLGGVTLESDLGLAGHSDADVLSHAIGEALLGALALGDLGGTFPTAIRATGGAGKGLEALPPGAPGGRGGPGPRSPRRDPGRPGAGPPGGPGGGETPQKGRCPAPTPGECGCTSAASPCTTCATSATRGAPSSST